MKNNCFRNNNLIRIFILATVFLALFLMAISTWAAEKPVAVQNNKTQQVKYPPYPDVWSMELPVSEIVTYTGIKIVKMPNNDLMIGYITDWRELKSEKAKDFNPRKDIVKKHGGFLFFASKEVKFTSSAEYYDFFGKMRKEGREMKSFPITFTDRSTMRMQPECASAAGCNTLGWYLERKDKNGTPLIQKKLLYIYDKALKKEAPMSESNANYKGKYYYERVDWPSELEYVPVGDDTFLLIGLLQYQKQPSVIIIRFDKDFKTKSNLINKKLFLFDEEIYKKIRPMDSQTENKFFYDYLTKQKKGGQDGNNK